MASKYVSSQQAEEAVRRAAYRSQFPDLGSTPPPPRSEIQTEDTQYSRMQPRGKTKGKTKGKKVSKDDRDFFKFLKKCVNQLKIIQTNIELSNQLKEEQEKFFDLVKYYSNNYDDIPSSGTRSYFKSMRLLLDNRYIKKKLIKYKKLSIESIFNLFEQSYQNFEIRVPGIDYESKFSLNNLVENLITSKFIKFHSNFMPIFSYRNKFSQELVSLENMYSKNDSFFDNFSEKYYNKFSALRGRIPWNDETIMFLDRYKEQINKNIEENIYPFKKDFQILITTLYVLIFSLIKEKNKKVLPSGEIIYDDRDTMTKLKELFNNNLDKKKDKYVNKLYEQHLISLNLSNLEENLRIQREERQPNIDEAVRLMEQQRSERVKQKKYSLMKAERLRKEIIAERESQKRMKERGLREYQELKKTYLDQDIERQIDELTMYKRGSKFNRFKKINDFINAKVPDEFLCPLTLQIMQNPVVTGDGFTYEREAIEAWFNSQDNLSEADIYEDRRVRNLWNRDWFPLYKSPKTNLPLPNNSKALILNRNLKSRIDDWLELNYDIKRSADGTLPIDDIEFNF